MCPLYPLHLVFSWSFLLLVVWLCGGQSLASALSRNSSFNVRLLLKDHLEEQLPLQYLDLNEDQNVTVTLYIDDLPADAVGEVILKEESEDGLDHVDISPDTFPLQYDAGSGQFEPQEITVSGSFLGFSKIRLTLTSGSQEEKELMELSQEVDVKVHREKKVLDIVFIHVIIIIVVIAYVNMGCAIHLDVIKETLKRPIAPAIGLASQYLFMPLVSFALGYALFPSNRELWLGLFLTGCAPGGGGSNMWTYVLGGSLDLSITMTFLSTVFAFAALPCWVFALGPVIFEDGYYGKLPYKNIAALAFVLVVPCAIGIAIRKRCPKAADFMKKMLKPLSLFFIFFIMTFGVYCKLYLFSFFSWKVAIVGFCLPLFGFIFGAVVSLLMKRKWEEIVAISIETGVQNTGLAIGVITIALKAFSPMDEIAIVLPVAVATFTPVPLLTCLLMKCLRDRKRQRKAKFDDHSPDSRIVNSNMRLIKDSNGNAKEYGP